MKKIKFLINQEEFRRKSQQLKLDIYNFKVSLYSNKNIYT